MARPTAPKRSTRLTRAEIVSAALSLIDSDGLDALSMRRLAAILGVEAMSLYHHFPNKDAMLDAVVAAIVREMQLPDPLPGDWVELLVSMIDAFRVALVSHPNALPIVLARPLAPPEDAMVTPASVLSAQGFDPASLAQMYQALMSLTFGHALVACTPQGPPSASPAEKPQPVAALDDDAFRRAARYLIEGFSAEVGGGIGGTDAD